MTDLAGATAQDARQIQLLQQSQEENLNLLAQNQARWEEWLRTPIDKPPIDLSKIIPKAPPVLYDISPLITPELSQAMGVDPEKAKKGEYLKKGDPLKILQKIPWQNLYQTFTLSHGAAPTVPSSDINYYRAFKAMAMVPPERRREFLWTIQQTIYEKAVLDRLAKAAIAEVGGPDWLDAWREQVSQPGVKATIMQAIGRAGEFAESALDVAFMDKLTGIISHTVGAPISQMNEMAEKIGEEAFKDLPEEQRKALTAQLVERTNRLVLGAMGFEANSWTTKIIEGAGGVAGFVLPGLTTGVLQLGRAGAALGGKLLASGTIKIAEAVGKVAAKSERVAKLLEDMGAVWTKALQASKVKAAFNIAKGIGQEAAAGATYDLLLSIKDKRADAKQGAITFGFLGALAPIQALIDRRLPLNQAYRLFAKGAEGAATGTLLHFMDPQMFDIAYRWLSDPKSVSKEEWDVFVKTWAGSVVGMTAAGVAHGLTSARELLKTELAGKSKSFMEATNLVGHQALLAEMKRLGQFVVMKEDFKEFQDLPPEVKEKSVVMVEGLRGVPRDLVEDPNAPAPNLDDPEVLRFKLFMGLRHALESKDSASGELWAGVVREAGKKLAASDDPAQQKAGKYVMHLADLVEKATYKGGLFGKMPSILNRPMSPDEATYIATKVMKSLDPWIGKGTKQEAGIKGFTDKPAAESVDPPPPSEGIAQFQIQGDGSRTMIFAPEGTPGSLVFQFHKQGVDITFTDAQGREETVSGVTLANAMAEMTKRFPLMEDSSRQTLQSLWDLADDELTREHWEWLTTGKRPEPPEEKPYTGEMLPDVVRVASQPHVTEEDRQRATDALGALASTGMDADTVRSLAEALRNFSSSKARERYSVLSEKVAKHPVYKEGEPVWVGIDEGGEPHVSFKKEPGKAWVAISKDVPRATREEILRELAWEWEDRRRVAEAPEIPEKPTWFLFRVKPSDKVDEIQVERVSSKDLSKDGVYIGLAPVKDDFRQGFVQKIVRVKDGKAEDVGVEAIGPDRTVTAILRRAALTAYMEARGKGEPVAFQGVTKEIHGKIRNLVEKGSISEDVGAALEHMAGVLGPVKADVVIRLVEKLPKMESRAYGKVKTTGTPKGMAVEAKGLVYGADSQVPFHLTLIKLAKGASYVDAMHEFLHAWWFNSTPEQRARYMEAMMEEPGARRLLDKGMAPDEAFATFFSLRFKRPHSLNKAFLERAGLPKDVPQLVQTLHRVLRAETGEPTMLDQIYREILLTGREAAPLGLPEPPKIEEAARVEKPIEATEPAQVADALEEAKGLKTDDPAKEARILQEEAQAKEPEITAQGVFRSAVDRVEAGESLRAVSRRAAETEVPTEGVVSFEVPETAKAADVFEGVLHTKGTTEEVEAYLELRDAELLPDQSLIRTQPETVAFVLGDPFRVTSDGTVHLDFPHLFALPVFRGWKAPAGAMKRVTFGLLVDRAPEAMADYVAQYAPIEATETGVFLGDVGDLLNQNSVRFVRALGEKLKAKGIQTFVFTGRPDLAKDLIGAPGIKVFERLHINPEQAYRLAKSRNYKDLYLHPMGAEPLRLVLSLYNAEAQMYGIKNPLSLFKRISISPALSRNPEMLEEMMGVLKEAGISDPESLIVPTHDVSRAEARAYVGELERRTDIVPSPLAWERAPDPYPLSELSQLTAQHLQESHESEARLRDATKAAGELLSLMPPRGKKLPSRETVEPKGPSVTAVWMNAAILARAGAGGEQPPHLWTVRDGKLVPKDAVPADLVDEIPLWKATARKKVVKALDGLKKALASGEGVAEATDAAIRALDAWENGTGAVAEKDLIPLAAWVSAGGTGKMGDWGRPPMTAILEVLRSGLEAYRQAGNDVEGARELMNEARMVLTDPATTLLRKNFAGKRAFQGEKPDPLLDLAWDITQGDWLPGEVRLSVDIEPSDTEKLRDAVKANAVDEVDHTSGRLFKRFGMWDPYGLDVPDTKAFTRVDLFKWVTDHFAEADKVFGTHLTLTAHDALARWSRVAEGHENDWRAIKKMLPKDKEAKALWLAFVDAGDDPTYIQQRWEAMRRWQTEHPGQGDLLGAARKYQDLMKKIREDVLNYHPYVVRAWRKISSLAIKIAHYSTMMEQRSREIGQAQNEAEKRKLRRSKTYAEKRLKEAQDKQRELLESVRSFREGWGHINYYPHRFEQIHPLWEKAGPVRKVILWAAGVPKTVPRQKQYEELTPWDKPESVPSGLKSAHMKYRKGVLGYSEDMDKVIPAYIRSIYRVIAYNDLMAKMDGYINGTWQPVLNVGHLVEGEELRYQGGRWKFLNRPVDDEGKPLPFVNLQNISRPEEIVQVSIFDRSLMARRGGIKDRFGPDEFHAVEKYLELIRGKVPEKSQTFLMEVVRGFGRRFRGMLYHTLLGMGNFPAALQNLVGGQMMSMVEYGPEYLKGLWKAWHDKDLRREISENLDRMGIVEFALFAKEIQNSAAGKFLDTLQKLSFFPFSLVESFNRITAYAAGYAIAKERGLEGRRAHMAALRGVHRTQFLFSVAMNPGAFKNEFMKSTLMLWQYNLRFAGRMASWVAKGKARPEYLFRYMVFAGIGSWFIQKLTGLKAWDAVGSYMDEVPGLKTIGTALEANTGVRLQIPMLFPWGLAAPLRLLSDGATAVTEQVTGVDPMALQKFVNRDATLIFGSFPKRLADILSAEKQPDGRYLIRYSANVAELFGFEPRSGMVKKDRMGWPQLVIDLFAGSHADLDEYQYRNKRLLEYESGKVSGRNRMYREMIQRGVRLYALGRKVAGLALLMRAAEGIQKESLTMPTTGYLEKYAKLVNAPADLLAVTRANVPKEYKFRILTQLLARENREGVYPHTVDDLALVVQRMFGDGSGITPQTAAEFMKEYNLYVQRAKE